MRIISGKFRRQSLLMPPSSITRPTADRTREAVFNIITSLNPQIFLEETILDAFAGSGSLGLEALSRGASHVTFLENNPQALQVLNQNAIKLGVQSQCAMTHCDVANPPKAPHPMTMVFLDPPYEDTRTDLYITTLHQQGWISPQTLIVLETSSKKDLILPRHITILDQRRYGAALISFLTYNKN